MAENSDDQDQKSEEPTQRRLEEAEKKGQIAFSREVNNFFVMLAFAIIIMWMTPGIMLSLKESLAIFITAPDDINVSTVDVRNGFIQVSLIMAKALAGPMVVIMSLALGASIMQSKFIISAERIKPKLEKISIMKGFGRLFSVRSVVEFLKSLVKITIVGGAAIIAVWHDLPILEILPSYDVASYLAFIGGLSGHILVGVCCVLFLIAILDYAYQHHEYMKSLRMSKQEIKEEHKQQEGDPHIKGRLRQIRMERARKRMMAAVPKADVVITNPTHYAIALQYDTKVMRAPLVLAKGIDQIALRIREVAEEHNIPVVENPPLARALYAGAELDQEIPYEHYKAVAEVIGYVYRLKGKL